MLHLLKNSISSLNTESSTTSNSIIKDTERNPVNSHKSKFKERESNDSNIFSSSVDQHQLNKLMPNLKAQSVKKEFELNMNNNENKIRIRSSSKSKNKVKDDIIKEKFVNHSVEKNADKTVQKQKIVMGQTAGNFFKKEKMSATSDSFFGSTRNQQNSFYGTASNFNTTNGFNKEIKFRSTLDKNNLKREMKRFKTYEEPVIERNFNPETLKKLTGCRDLLKVKFFSIRD